VACQLFARLARAPFQLPWLLKAKEPIVPLSGPIDFIRTSLASDDESPPPKSPTRLSGGGGGVSGRPDRMQGSGQRDVVDAVPGSHCERPILSPASHATVDESWIALQADIRPESQALHHARTIALDQDLCHGGFCRAMQESSRELGYPPI